MRLLLVAAAVVVLVACGGTAPGGSPDGGSPDGGPPPAQGVALQGGAYNAQVVAMGSALSAAPAGPAITTTLITDGSGVFSMVFPNYDFARGANIVVNPDKSLSASDGLVLIHQDGTTDAKPTIAGTANGITIVGTLNNNTFDVTRSTLSEQPFTVAQMAGTYRSTSSSAGLWAVLAIDPTGTIQGYAYASEADAQAGNTSKAVRRYYSGTITYEAAGPFASYTVPPNVFNIGFAYEEIATGLRPATTYGFAYFTTTGLVALTMNPVTHEQFSAVFAKQ